MQILLVSTTRAMTNFWGGSYTEINFTTNSRCYVWNNYFFKRLSDKLMTWLPFPNTKHNVAVFAEPTLTESITEKVEHLSGFDYIKSHNFSLNCFPWHLLWIETSDFHHCVCLLKMAKERCRLIKFLQKNGNLICKKNEKCWEYTNSMILSKQFEITKDEFRKRGY